MKANRLDLAQFTSANPRHATSELRKLMVQPSQSSLDHVSAISTACMAWVDRAETDNSGQLPNLRHDLFSVSAKVGDLYQSIIQVASNNATECKLGDVSLFRECLSHTARETAWAPFPVVLNGEPAWIAKWCVGPPPGDVNQNAGRVAFAPWAECPTLPGGAACPLLTLMGDDAARSFRKAILAAHALACKDTWRDLPDALVWIAPVKEYDHPCTQAIRLIGGESFGLALCFALLSYWSEDPLDAYSGGLLSGAIYFAEGAEAEIIDCLNSMQPTPQHLIDKLKLGSVHHVEHAVGETPGLKISGWQRWNRDEPNKFQRFLIPDKAKAEES
ncbi:MAG TPA: hypothetical protein PLX06_09660, partial [Fimbriimonadaceae bacterium]|nr:hypothetical protein [Fimbriimonadaceae bacterium]